MRSPAYLLAGKAAHRARRERAGPEKRGSSKLGAVELDALAHHRIQSILLCRARIIKLLGVPLEALVSLLFSFEFATFWHGQSFQRPISPHPELWIS